jgi:hypothetical protein
MNRLPSTNLPGTRLEQTWTIQFSQIGDRVTRVYDLSGTRLEQDWTIQISPIGDRLIVADFALADIDWHLKNRMVGFATAWKGAVVDPFRLQVGARGLVEHLEHNLYELV